MIPVIVDTREQRPLTFPSEAFATERKTLVTGDYSIAGYEDRFCIERKGIGDAVQTVIGQWQRFVKELNRMACLDIAIIVIEANVSDVMEHRYDGEANPESVMGRFASITLDYNIPVMWWGPRTICESRVHQFMRLAHGRLGVPVK